MTTTTPSAVTPEVLSLARIITPNAEPILLTIEKDIQSAVDFCNLNVRSRIRSDGGEPVFGWSFYLWPGMYAEALQHVVWKDSTGKIRDFTPCAEGQKTRLFIPDPSCHIPDLWMSGIMMARYIKISTNRHVSAYISAMNRYVRLRREKYTPMGGGIFSFPSNIAKQEQALMIESQKALYMMIAESR